ncbi:MAG TPA: hypothetical protein ENN28_03975 [Candidatus Uhrbacteria bacterium]|nr:hypothetical protein [Candidatus Uhrbacteria bacterium]
MENKKLTLEYPADVWKSIILILLFCKKEYNKDLAGDPDYIEICRQIGYYSDHEKILPALISTIAAKVNGDSGNIRIELLQTEWEIVYDIISLFFEDFEEGDEIDLEVEFQPEEDSFIEIPEEISVVIFSSEILCDLGERIFGVKEDDSITLN